MRAACDVIHCILLYRIKPNDRQSKIGGHQRQLLDTNVCISVGTDETDCARTAPISLKTKSRRFYTFIGFHVFY